jgi:cobalt transporter subunit CbtA
MFTRIIAAAALSGLLAGLLLTAIQQIEIAPLIRAAEAREAAGAAAQGANEAHAHEAWVPQNGLERLIATTVADIVLATAFALLLGAAMSRRQQTGWRAGLAWGIAGYAVFFVAPALGLAPELPGANSAPLADRQIWWIAAASSSAAGLWLAAFGTKPLTRILGIVLLVAPQTVGAPLPPPGVDSNTGGDGRAFIRATYLANAALWLALGILFGLLSKPGKSPAMADGHRGGDTTGVDARTSR